MDKYKKIYDGNGFRKILIIRGLIPLSFFGVGVGVGVGVGGVCMCVCVCVCVWGGGGGGEGRYGLIFHLDINALILLGVQWVDVLLRWFSFGTLVVEWTYMYIYVGLEFCGDIFRKKNTWLFSSASTLAIWYFLLLIGWYRFSNVLISTG